MSIYCVWQALKVTILVLEGLLLIAMMGDICHERRYSPKEYYYGEKLKKKFEEEKIPIYKIVPAVACSFIAGLFMAGGVYVFDLQETFMKEFEINLLDFPVLMFSTFITLVTFLGVIRTFDKETYIFYSTKTLARQILLSSKIKWMLGIIVAEFFAYFVLVYIKKVWSDNYMEQFTIVLFIVMLFIWYVIITVNIVLEFIDILFGHQNEHKLLKGLYKELWYNNYNELGCEISAEKVQGKKGGVLELFSFLVEDFIDAAKKIEFEQIEDVAYGTYLKTSSKLYKIAKGKSIIRVLIGTLIFFVWALSIGYKSNGYVEGGMRETISSLLASILFIVLFFGVVCCKKWNNMWKGLIQILFWSKGYYVSYGKKKQLVVDVPWYKNDVWKFITGAKNLIVFLLMAQNLGEEIEEELKKGVDRYKDNTEIKIITYIFTSVCPKNKIMSAKNIDKKYKLMANAIIADIKDEDMNVGDSGAEKKVKKARKEYWDRFKNYIGRNFKEGIQSILEFMVSVCILTAVYWGGFKVEDKMVIIWCILCAAGLLLLYHDSNIGLMKNIFKAAKIVSVPMLSMIISLNVSMAFLKDSLSIALGQALDTGNQVIVSIGIMMLYIMFMVALELCLWLKNILKMG